MESYNLDLVVQQGATFSKTFTFAKDGLAWPTGTITWSAKLCSSDFKTVIDSFSVSATYAETENTVVISLTATKTSALPATRYKWAMEALRSSDGWVWPVFSGNLFVKAEANK